MPISQISSSLGPLETFDISIPSGASVIGYTSKINNPGQVLASYETFDSSTFTIIVHSFLYVDGTVTALAVPGAADINDAGVILGAYPATISDSVHPEQTDQVTYGVLYNYNDNSSSTFTLPSLELGPEDNPSAPGYYWSPTAINASGQILTYNEIRGTDYGQVFGGVELSNGNITLVLDPLANGDPNYQGATSPADINNAGQIIGNVVPDDSPAGQYVGFLYSGGAFTTIANPLAAGGRTYLISINDTGEILGYYFVGSGYTPNYFLYYEDTYHPLNLYIQEGNSYIFPTITGFNDSDELVGFYSDSTGTHFFKEPTTLFSTATDTVDFNGLQPSVPDGLTHGQQSVLQAGADKYHGLGGNDVVALPNQANYNESVGNGITLGWDNTQTFATGSKVGDFYRITGGDGADNIQLGSGFDAVYGSPGNDTITGGSGQDAFVYSDGAFSDFSGFASSTIQTIQGGHSSFLSGGGRQNFIVLPGSPNDYTIDVSFPGGDAFSTTQTTIKTAGTGGFQRGITFNTTGVEYASFESQVSLANVALTGGSMASEAMKLADEVYGYSSAPRVGYHLQDPLAYEALNNATSYNSAAAAVSRNWYALQAIDLGMGPADFLQHDNLRYSFVDGYYQAYATDDTLPISGDHPEADALVLVGKVNDLVTLSVSFSGTDQKADFWDYFTFATYYAKYQPLIDALKQYATYNGVQQILVSGHSLGAGALQYFMNDFGAGTGGPRVYAYTAGSPGAEVDTSDPRVVNFIHTDDLVPFLGTLSVAGPILGISQKFRAGEIVDIDSDAADPTLIYGTDEHKVGLYEQDVLKLESFATDSSSPFQTIAAEIKNNQIDQLPLSIRVAVGKPSVFDPNTGIVGGITATGLASYSSDVRAYSKDQYVLGNENNTATTFIVSAGNLVASGSRVFDGVSLLSTVDLPYGSSFFDYSQKTTDGKGYVLNYTPIDLLSGAKGPPELVGTLYRVQTLVFLNRTVILDSSQSSSATMESNAPADTAAAQYVVHLDGSPVSIQSPGAGQTTLTIDPSYAYADTGSNNLTITGSGNGDIIAVGTGNVTINESAGNNTVFVKDAHSTGSLTAHFASGDNMVVLGAGTGNVSAGTGNDDFVSGSGNATFDGGGGTNTLEFSDLSTPGIVAIIQGGGGTVNSGGANGIDHLSNIQDLIDIGTDRSNGDVFYVDANETVTAGSSFNYLIELSAGVTLAFGASFTGITEFVSNVGTNTVDFSLDTSFAYVYGSTGNDTLTLGSGGGYMFGEGGTNVLTGGANATNLFVGGGGTDTMDGGTGTASNYYFVDGLDQVNGAGGFNAVIELASGVTVQLGSAQYQHVQEFVSNGGNNAVTVANTDSDFVYLYGGTGNDTLSTGSAGGYLFGEGATNVLTGGGGLNVFVSDGASGVDTMNGGSGNNIYYIDDNSTVHGAGTFNAVIELQQNATLTLGSAQLGTDVQQVILNGGTNVADFHTATSSVYLYGGSGNDTLFGGTGNDFLYGGLGTNTFKFAAGWGADTIEDWTAGTNSIVDVTGLAGLGVHVITDLTQTITGGNDVITSGHTGANSITLFGVGSALATSSFHFA